MRQNYSICVVFTFLIGGIVLSISSSAKGQIKVVKYHGIRPTDPGGLVGLRNPERGFRLETRIAEGADTTTWLFGYSHNIKHVVPPNPIFTDDRWRLLVNYYEPFGITVVQAFCYLTEYKSRPISKRKLALLQRSLDRMRRMGVKALLIFAYEKAMGPNFKGLGMGATKEWILRHIEQLKPILQKNADVIFAMHAGFIGAWGEWHSATHFKNDGDWEKRAEVVKALLDVLPPDRMIQLRCPQYKKKILATSVFKGLVRKYAPRIGFCNHGFFAGKTEGGTWKEPPYFANPGNPEFDYMTKESAYVVVDGELFWSNLIQLPGKQVEGNMADNGFKVAVRMRLHHYTTFSIAHSYSGREGKNYAIDKWMITPITEQQLKRAKMPISDGYFEDQFGNKVKRTQFEYIRDHLGYRLELQRASFPTKLRCGGRLKVQCELINRGFATLYNPRDVYIVLINLDQKVYPFKVKVDVRKWQPYRPGDKNFKPLVHRFGINVKLPNKIKPGWYQLGIWLPDKYDSIHYDSRYAVRFANRDTIWWVNDENKYGVNLIGTVKIVEK